MSLPIRRIPKLIYGGFAISLLLLAVALTDSDGYSDILSVPAATVSIITCAAYGLWRATVFHPSNDLAYLKWLSHTPWRPGLPLPLPLLEPNCTWLDLLVVGLGMAIASPAEGALWARPVAAAMGAFALANIPVLRRTGSGWHAYAVAAVVPLLWHTWGSGWDIASAAAMFLFAADGISRGWRRYPWPALLAPPRRTDPFAPRPPYSILKVAAGALLSGWYLYTLLCMINPRSRGLWELTTVALIVEGFLMAWIRLSIYRSGKRSPLNLPARLITGGLLIWKHDRILLAPLAVALAPISILLASSAVDLDPRLMLSAGTAILLLLAYALPPSLRNWDLTGAYTRTSPLQPWMRDPNSASDTPEEVEFE